MPKKNLRVWPADSVERWPVENIKPYPRNARLHSEEQVDLIAASMQRYGVTAPLLVDEDGVLIYGHGRLRAALKLGLEALPVSKAVGWSEDEKAAYRIADNQIGLRSNWDDQLLRAEFRELKVGGYDIELLGFEDGQLSSLTLLDPQQQLNDPIEQWQGMPAYKQEVKTAFRSVLIHFANQAAVDEFGHLFPNQAFTDKTKYLWFPEAPEDDVRDKQWVSSK